MVFHGFPHFPVIFIDFFFKFGGWEEISRTLPVNFFQVQRLGVHRTLRGRGCLASARYFQAGEGEGPGRMDGTTSGNFCNISVIFFFMSFFNAKIQETMEVP